MAADNRIPGQGRQETPEERADRRWIETLQEVRVTQTGAQILFAFLLGVAFTNRFASLGEFDKDLYVTAVMLAALANGTLVAPVAFHLFTAGRGIKPHLVRAAGRMTAVGITLLGCTVAASVLLLLRVTVGAGWAWALTAVVMIWFGICWVVLPNAVLHRALRRMRDEEDRTAGVPRHDDPPAG